jgi:hypothetical protein
MIGERFDIESLSPKCPECGRTMRLVGLEAHTTNPRISVHTYVCICGETIAVEIGSV